MNGLEGEGRGVNGGEERGGEGMDGRGGKRRGVNGGEERGGEGRTGEGRQGEEKEREGNEWGE